MGDVGFNEESDCVVAFGLLLSEFFCEVFSSTLSGVGGAPSGPPSGLWGITSIALGVIVAVRRAFLPRQPVR